MVPSRAPQSRASRLSHHLPAVGLSARWEAVASSTAPITISLRSAARAGTVTAAASRHTTGMFESCRIVYIRLCLHRVDGLNQGSHVAVGEGAPAMSPPRVALHARCMVGDHRSVVAGVPVGLHHLQH